MKHAFLFCTFKRTHLLCSNEDIHTPVHISVILGRRQSWQPHVGHPGTMRQASKQLYYSSGMAGSAEGEALTPILMRFYASQWPSVCRRIRQKQSYSYQGAYCLAEPLPHSTIQEKKLFALCSFHLSPLNLWNILTNLLHTKQWQIYSTNRDTWILLLQEHATWICCSLSTGCCWRNQSTN